MFITVVYCQRSNRASFGESFKNLWPFFGDGIPTSRIAYCRRGTRMRKSAARVPPRLRRGKRGGGLVTPTFLSAGLKTRTCRSEKPRYRRLENRRYPLAVRPAGWQSGVTAQGLRRRKNLAGPVSGSCTRRSRPLTVGVFVTADHEIVGTEVAASRT